MSNHANNAAAVAAGWVRVQIDRGSGSASNPRFISRYEKSVTGNPNQAGGTLFAEGQDNTSQANADTAALNALNNQRGHRYGTGATVNSGHTFDVT